MDHPSVEFKLPLDDGHHQFEVPRDTTLFFWGAVAPGTQERIAPIDTRRGSHQFTALCEAQKRISWSLCAEDDPTSLVSEIYREKGYKGLAWWIACDPLELPTSVVVQFRTEGDQPTVEGEPVVLWTEQGEMFPWGTTVESTMELVPSSSQVTQFPTRRESLWDRHKVYVPLQQPTTEEAHG